jgi:putative restriction endonuclease
LLRSDVHTLFDRGYVTVARDYRVRVSRKLKADFDNGAHYYQLEGSALWIPRSSEAQPRIDLLEWHSDTVFRG